MNSTVEVPLQERAYTIWIGAHTLDRQLAKAKDFLADWQHAVIVFDEHLDATAERINTTFQAMGLRTSFIRIASGEKSKSLEQLSKLWDSLFESRADRKSVMIAIGGGVVGDLAGFAASTYMRGLRFIQIPTTLLSMVDSSVGGKTGINLPAAKNIVGSFWQPHAVCIDTSLLETLPDREFDSGLAEIVKYGIILDAEFFAYLENHVEGILNRDANVLTTIISRSCQLKASVVAEDERETTGLRAILNYGHTFGHAIEATTDFGTYLHGEAISIGMTMAGQLAVRREMWRAEELERQTKLLFRLRLPVSLDHPVNTADLLKAMRSDKKNEHGQLQLILPHRIGKVALVKGVTEQDVAQTIDENRTLKTTGR